MTPNFMRKNFFRFFFLLHILNDFFETMANNFFRNTVYKFCFLKLASENLWQILFKSLYRGKKICADLEINKANSKNTGTKWKLKVYKERESYC
jgi:hypothetical protein